MKTQRNVKTVVLLLTAIGIGVIVFRASGGSLEPNAPPSPTMHSLDEIYNLVNGQNQQPQALASYENFLNINNIPGQTTDKNHKDWIEVLSWSWGMNRSGTQSGTPGTSLFWKRD
ncbi:MAG: type VI secretion system tube protein Hcp [Sedimentisphaerales bacterium]|jgi:hypothetical protein